MRTQESNDQEQRASNASTLMWLTAGVVLIVLTILAEIYWVPMWRGPQ